MYLYFEATATLYILTIAALIFFFAGVFASVTLWRKGKAKSLYHKASFPAIVKAFVLHVLLQVQILKLSFTRWFMHTCIFIGFMGLLAQTSWLAFLSHCIPADSALAKIFFEMRGRLALDVWGDVFGLILLLGLLIAIVRRYIVRVEQLDTIAKDTISILLLLVITITGFMSEAFRLSAASASPDLAYSFAGLWLANIFDKLSIPLMDYQFIVWIHVLFSLFFIGYIPFSKMWHALVSPVEILLDASEHS